jgi:hypothetical protein
VHLRGIAHYAVGRLSKDEAAALAALLGRFVDEDEAADDGVAHLSRDDVSRAV